MDNTLLSEYVICRNCGNGFDFATSWPYFLILALSILDLIVRAIALWKSARAGSKAWFVALMILNTLGVLPLVYILFFAPKTEKM